MDWALAVNVIITGLLVVFMALVVLTFLIYGLGRLIGGKSNKPALPAQEQKPAPLPEPVVEEPAAMEVEEGIPGEIVAAITAAVTAAMEADGPKAAGYAVKSIKRAREARPVWGFAGMQQNTRPF